MVEQDGLNQQSTNQDDSASPGFHFMSNFQSMHNLTEKLILLKYDKDFCPIYKCQPIHRYYFTIQTNPGEQFYLFSCLAAWLIKDKCRLNSKSELNPQDYEDPNVTIHGILDALMLIVDKVSIPPNKIKQGYGWEVIWILNTLADDALTKNQPSRGAINVVTLVSDKDDNQDNDLTNELTDDDIEINFDNQYTLLDDDLADGSDGYNQACYNNTEMPSSSRPQGILLSQVDSQEWRLEVERVLPQLKVILRPSDHKADWRIHVQEMYHHRGEIEKYFEATRTSLEKLSENITKGMEKIEGREKYLHLQLETLTSEYNSLVNHMRQISENYKMVSGGVTAKSRKLAAINDELDAVKEEMEERGTAMTDGTPLINIRKALQKIKQEMVSLDIRIGVAMHTLLQIKIQDCTKDALEKQQPLQTNRINMSELTF